VLRLERTATDALAAASTVENGTHHISSPNVIHLHQELKFPTQHFIQIIPVSVFWILYK
jgi:hypothetical protein